MFEETTVVSIWASKPTITQLHDAVMSRFGYPYTLNTDKASYLQELLHCYKRLAIINPKESLEHYALWGHTVAYEPYTYKLREEYLL